MAENHPPPYVLRHILGHYNHTNVQSLQFSPDGLLLAVACDPHPLTYFLLDPITLHTEFIGHEGRVTDSSNSLVLATSSYDTTIRVWDVALGTLLRTLIGHNGVVTCLKFNGVSDMIVSGSSDETVRIWDVNSGACNMIIPASAGHVTGVDFSPDGSMIVACSLAGLCRLWETATGNIVVTIKDAFGPAVGLGSVKFSSNGESILIGTMNNTVRIWSMNLVTFSHIIYMGHQNTTRPIQSTFSGANDRYIVSGSEDNCIYIWEILSGRMIQKIHRAHMAPVLSVSCHPTENMIASASPDDNLGTKIWCPHFSYVSILKSINWPGYNT